MNEQIVGWFLMTLLITSFLCCTLLASIFFNLGARFILFSWLNWVHSGTYILKTYLIAINLLKLETFDSDGWTAFNCILIVLNNFFVVAYNMSLLLTCTHIYLTVVKGSKYASWPNAQSFHISLSITAAFIQSLHTTSTIYHHNKAIIPFPWINLVVLTILLTSCPIMLGHLSLKFCKCRERVLDLLKKSAISRTLCFRFLFGLIGIILVTAHSFYKLLTSNKTMGNDPFGPFDPFRCKVTVLAARYTSSAFSGIILFIVFVTATESWIMFKLFLKRFGQFLKIIKVEKQDTEKDNNNNNKAYPRNRSAIVSLTTFPNSMIIEIPEKARSNSIPVTQSELQASSRENDITQFI